MIEEAHCRYCRTDIGQVSAPHRGVNVRTVWLTGGRAHVGAHRHAGLSFRMVLDGLRLGTRPPLSQVVRYVDAHRVRFGVEPICRVLQVAPSSSYAARHRPWCQREVHDEALKVEIGRVYAANYGVYGARKVWRQLHRDGVPAARCTVERLMRDLGLAGRTQGTKRRTKAAGVERVDDRD